jgi:hypothetical protein
VLGHQGVLVVERAAGRERDLVLIAALAVAAIAIGYPGDPVVLPDGLRERELAERTRRPMESFVYTEKWGSTATFVRNG